MPIENLNSALKVIPSAAESIVLTPANTWVEMIASAPSDLFIAGIAIRDTSGAVIFNDIDIDIGKGAGGAETVVSTFGIYLESLGGFATDPLAWLPAGIPISGISSGDRIAARSTRAGVLCALMYLPNPLTSGTLETTAKPMKTTSSVVAYTTNVTPWANAAYVQMIASSAAALVIDHVVIIFAAGAAAVEVEIDVATGAAASEVVITTIRTFVSNIDNFPSCVLTPILLDNIGNGVRVAVRVRSSGASTGLQLRLGYYEKPL